MLLADLTVLIADDDVDALDVLSAHLMRQGAKPHAVRSARAALEVAAEREPDAVICELNLPDLDGRALLAALRSTPASSEIPAIALTTQPALVGHARALGAPFEKYLLKPARLSDVTDALCSVLRHEGPPEPGSVPSLSAISDAILRHDYRALLGQVNASCAYRHTAFFRFDEAELTSVWTFDRESPRIDPFPLRQRIDDTPCVMLRDQRAPLIIEDALRDLRPPRQHGVAAMRSFCGVPLVSEGAASGVLCHFDPYARERDDGAVELLERVARMFSLLAAKSMRPLPR